MFLFICQTGVRGRTAVSGMGRDFYRNEVIILFNVDSRTHSCFLILKRLMRNVISASFPFYSHFPTAQIYLFTIYFTSLLSNIRKRSEVSHKEMEERSPFKYYRSISMKVLRKITTTKQDERYSCRGSSIHNKHTQQEKRPINMGTRTDTTQQEERPTTMGCTSALTGPQTDTYTTQREKGPPLWDTITHRRDRIRTQHNRKEDPPLWDTLGHRRDHKQTYTTQQERPVTTGYTSV
jgi:hypothetical protein